MDDRLKSALAKAIAEATSTTFEIQSAEPQSGGCINSTYLLNGAETDYFAKLNSADRIETFEAEAEALREFNRAKAIRTPIPIAVGEAHGQSYLILEALPLSRSGNHDWREMGMQLAQLHRYTNEKFGWHRNNVIGSTPQRNTRTADWGTFFREQRLRPQFELARRNGYHFEFTDQLIQSTSKELENHTPLASLLHGDLWSGNIGFLTDRSPTLFDPATYFGDRETDLAFTEFFGGFSPSFYESYHEEWPLPEGYETRKPIYNLYHALNHLNLFGTSYLRTTERLIDQILWD